MSTLDSVIKMAHSQVFEKNTHFTNYDVTAFQLSREDTVENCEVGWREVQWNGGEWMEWSRMGWVELDGIECSEIRVGWGGLV